MPEYLDEIESDMSVFHRVDDMYALPADRFFRWSERLFAYQGALWARARADVDREPSSSSPATVPGSSPEVQDVPAVAAPLHKGFQGDPRTAFPPVIEIGHPN